MSFVLSDNLFPVLLDDVDRLVYYGDAHSIASCSMVALNYPPSHHIDEEDGEEEGGE